MTSWPRDRGDRRDLRHRRGRPRGRGRARRRPRQPFEVSLGGEQLGASTCACPASTTCSTPWRRSPRSRTPGVARRGGASSSGFSGAARRFQETGRAAAWSSSTTTPTTPPRSPRRSGGDQWRHRRVIAVFQPHLFSRTRYLQREFGQRADPGRRSYRHRHLPGSRGARAGRHRQAGRRRLPGRTARRARQLSAAAVRRRTPPREPGARRRPRADHRRRRRLSCRRASGRRALEGTASGIAAPG